MADGDDFDERLMVMLAHYEAAAAAMQQVAVTIELMVACPQAVSRSEAGSTITFARKVKGNFDAEIASIRALIAKRHTRRLAAEADDPLRVM